MIFPYLFRVQSSSSQVSRTDEGFFSQIEPPEHLSSPDYRDTLSNHLLWERKESPWISTTSSLLRALVFARYRCLQAEDDVRITMIDPRGLQSDTIFPANYLVKKYELKARGKLWHDEPDGEYLVTGKIPSNTFLGETTYKAISKQIETILPELADKPHHLTENLRKYYHGTQNELFRASKPKDQSFDLQAVAREYEAVRSISIAFGGEQISLPLTLMCLAFRRRTILDQEWLKIGDDFAGRAGAQQKHISTADISQVHKSQNAARS